MEDNRATNTHQTIMASTYLTSKIGNKIQLCILNFLTLYKEGKERFYGKKGFTEECHNFEFTKTKPQQNLSG